MRAKLKEVSVCYISCSWCTRFKKHLPTPLPNPAIQIARPSFYRPYCVFRALHGASALQRLVVTLYIYVLFALKRLCKGPLTPQVFLGFLNLADILVNSSSGHAPFIPASARTVSDFPKYTYYAYNIREVYV